MDRKGPGRVTPEKVYSLMKEGSSLWLVDIRGPLTYGECHIEGALNIPLGKLMLKNMPKDKLLVVVDDSLGNLDAEEAASALISKGADRVYVLEGGVYGWGRPGYPLAGPAASERSFAPAPVTVEELKKALKSGVTMKIYDLRGISTEQSLIPGALTVSGADTGKRLGNLTDGLAKATGKGLASKLKRAAQIVIVFSAEDDAAREALKVSRLGVGDVRYLLGGYDAVSAVQRKTVSTASEGCPTCPKTSKMPVTR